MASTFKALTFFFAVLALLTGGHARANDQAASVFDVTDYGAAPSSSDNRDPLHRRQLDAPVPQGHLRRRRRAVRGAVHERRRARCGDRWRSPAVRGRRRRRLPPLGRRLDHVQRPEQTPRHRRRHPRRPGQRQCQVEDDDPGLRWRDELDVEGPEAREQPGLPREHPPLHSVRGGGPRHPRAGGQPQHGRRPRGPVEPRPHPGLGDQHRRRLRVRGARVDRRRRPRRRVRPRPRAQRGEPGEGRRRQRGGGRGARAGGRELHGGGHDQRRAHQDEAGVAAWRRVQHHVPGHRRGQRLQPHRHRPAVLPPRPLPRRRQAVAGADQRRDVPADRGDVEHPAGGAAAVQRGPAVHRGAPRRHQPHLRRRAVPRRVLQRAGGARPGPGPGGGAGGAEPRPGRRAQGGSG